MPSYIAISSVGTYGPINMDYDQSPMNAAVGVTFNTSGTTAAYGIQYTLLDQQVLSNIGSTLPIIWFNDATLSSGTSSGAAVTYNMPIAAVRCVVTAVSGSITFCVLQGSDG
jgi:hypothetical protein